MAATDKRKVKMKKTLVVVSISVVIFFSMTLALPGERETSEIKECTYQDEWNKTYGGDGSGANDIIKTTGGYMVVGDTFTNLGDGIEDGDAWIMKVGTKGDVIWKKMCVDSDEYAVFSSVLEVEDGYIAGGYLGENLMEEEVDFWITKIDKDGEQWMWSKKYGEGYQDFCEKIITSDDGGYIMVGTTYPSDSEPGDIWLVKTDRNGNMQWNKSYGGNKNEWGDDIIEIENGYLVSGITYSYTTYGGWDAWLIKIDKEGNEIWNKTYGWWDFEMNACIIEIEDGYMIAGYTLSTPTGGGDAYIIKIDERGDEIWSKKYGGKDTDHVSDFVKTDDGYILAGTTHTYNVGDFDAWLLKVDENGNEIWNKSFGEREREAANSVILDNGYYIIAGENSKKRGLNQVDQEAWLIKCGDYRPPEIQITKPREGYLYIFDREIMYVGKTWILGGVTVNVEADDPMSIIDKVEFYINGIIYHYKPSKTVFNPPYMWKWNGPAVGIGYPYIITAAGYYGNAGAAAVDKIEVYIVNLLPVSPSSASLHEDKI